ncbi:hypothetical protein [Bradyrhizobium sp. McL0616]|uniref:hypothetical protein n=1 Tax=Bradyrhizobium sp. McL0616 TaxID=3415674 RepID=UPI003CE907DF
MQTLGQTAHFNIQYDETLIGPDGTPNAISRAQRVMGVCEAEFGILASWYKITDGFGPDNRITIQIVADFAAGGASNNGYKGSNTVIKIGNQTSNANAVAAGQSSCMSLVAELVEVFASYRNQHGNSAWNASKSDGEGLSLLCARERFGTGYALFYGPPWVNRWLQSSRDTQWIGASENTDKNPVSFGLSLLFLYYLKNQLNHSIPDIIAAGGDNLAQTYQNLTGKNDAAAAFSQLINKYFRPGSTPQLATENPFPLLEGLRRDVKLSVDSEPEGKPFRVDQGLVLTSPFFTCPKDVYRWYLDSAPKKVTCIAATRGFGLPIYRWRVNGVDLNPPAQLEQPNVQGSITVQAAVTTDHAAQPATSALQDVIVNYGVGEDDFTSNLVFDLPGVVGHVDLSIEASASERFASSDVSWSAESLTVDNEILHWEARYYADRGRCMKPFLDVAARYIRSDAFFSLVKTLPDPPQEYTRVIRELKQAAAGIATLAQHAPDQAQELRHAMSSALGITPAVLHDLGGANIRSATAPDQAQENVESTKEQESE